MTNKKPSQRDFMRRLISVYGRDREKICEQYAKAERTGLVLRLSNRRGVPAEKYAEALWNDGAKKGWLDT